MQHRSGVAATGRPVILMSADIASMLGWSTLRARRWLISSGAGEKRGGRFITTAAKLAQHFPEVFDTMTSNRATTQDEDEW